MQNNTFAVIGGDKRCAYVAQFLVGDRFEVKTVGLELSGIVDASHINTLDEALATADFIILPLPLVDKSGAMPSQYSNVKLDVYNIIKSARRESVIFAGRIPGAVATFAQECGKNMFDYYLREELQVMNAVPTAEGAIEQIMSHIPTTVFGSSIMVTGFGRTAQALCLLLKAMGADVTVYARKSAALAHAKSVGCNVGHINKMSFEKLNFDAIVNSVPAQIFSHDVLVNVRPDCYMLDIASAPGGIDTEYAAKTGIAVDIAPSLPGQVAPKTAGRIIKETVLNMIEERGCAVE